MRSVPLRLLVAAAVMIMAGGAGAETQTGAGSAQVGAVVKWVYGYVERDSQTLTTGREHMTTSLADLWIRGRLDERISYRLELASSYNQDKNSGSLGIMAGPGETGTAGIRQASISITGLVPWTTIEVGTFMPPITNYMTRPLNDLDVIQYPLLNNAVNMDTGSAGNRPVTRDLSPWQQAGINLRIQTPGLITFDLGVWNGMMPNRLGNENENIAKATSMVFTFRPGDKISVSMAFWGEEFQPGGAFPGVSPGARRELTSWYVYASYLTDILELTADFGQARIPDIQPDTSGSLQELAWESWQMTAGYWLLPNLEALLRYEYFDPDTADRVQLPRSRYDECYWLTAGLNWRVAENIEASFNYVRKEETGKEAERGEPGRDPTLPGYDAKFGVQNNDLILVQVQAWQ